MIESYLLGIATGFFIGVAVTIVPELIRRCRREDFIDITTRRDR